MVMEQAQRVDDITRTLGIIINAKMADAHHKMEIVSKMPNILSNKMAELSRGVEYAGKMLNSLSYKNVLNRGYAIARGANNTIISSAEDIGKITSIEFADGVGNL
jgi:exonuclease VII large subunit